MFTDIVLMKQSIGCARKLLRARKLALKVLAIIYGKKLKNMVSYFSNVNAKDIIWLTFFDTNWIGIFSAILRLCMEMKRDPNQREIYDDEVVPGRDFKRCCECNLQGKIDGDGTECKRTAFSKFNYFRSHGRLYSFW